MKMNKFFDLINQRKHIKLPYLIKMTKLNGLISDEDEEMLAGYINIKYGQYLGSG